jgi:uncharacterized Ntn-hydrolase superfamily protein
LIATYSIVARDAASGTMGVAVQSCFFSVGTAVPWGEAGVGVVATQALANIDCGPQGLALLREGVTPDAALARLLARDPGRELRQVALLDSQGRVAAHTGARCVAAAGHLTGDGVSVQANMMTGASVWPAMLDAYQATEGDLAARLLAALEAAEAAGGDIRGRQSAALLVVSGERLDKPWHGRLFDLRVDDHPEPLAELARLLRLRRAYNAYNRFIDAVGANHLEEAAAALGETLEHAPELDEPRLSGAIGLYFQGQPGEARAIFREVFARKPGLAEWLLRMAAAGIVPGDPGLLQTVRDALAAVS